MSSLLQILRVSIPICVLSSALQANSCLDPAVLDQKLSKEQINEEVVSALYQGAVSKSQDHFVVVGKFEKLIEGNLVHELDHEDRRKCAKSSTLSRHEISGGIEYTYRKVYRFSGVRLNRETMVPFTTESTLLRVRIDGEFILDRLPPTEHLAVGTLKEADPVFFEVLNPVCAGFQAISEQQVKMLNFCYENGGCPWE